MSWGHQTLACGEVSPCMSFGFFLSNVMLRQFSLFLRAAGTAQGSSFFEPLNLVFLANNSLETCTFFARRSVNVAR
eukprot:2982098-Pleurochrysis_carterae.AAC.1